MRHALFLGLAALLLARPDFSGEWKMNPEKSDFGPLPAPLSRTDKIQHQDPRFKMARTQVNQQGESSADWDCTTDGNECAQTIRGVALKLRTTLKWDGNTLVFEAKGTFNQSEVRITERWSLSEDSKTITIQRHLAGQEGETDQTIVLEKQ